MAVLVSLPVPGQSTQDAVELLQKVRSVAEVTKNWRAEVIETSTMSGQALNLKSEVRTGIAVEAPLKVRRQSSGSDTTIFVCDGVETFYSGDGHSY